MGKISSELKKQFREEALIEVNRAFKGIAIPSAFEEALIMLENGKVNEVKAFLLFFTIYSEKCEEESAKLDKYEQQSDMEDDTFVTTKKFLKKKLQDFIKET